MYHWRKLASAKWMDAWEERLQAAVGLERVSFFLGPKARFVRIDAWNLNAREAQTLVRHFGGRSARQSKKNWTAIGTRRVPLKIRNRLIIVSTERERERCRRLHPNRAVMMIPASIAFGTGEHPTTATCLRFLADQLRPGMTVADAGTGSGILAIAAALLGAAEVTALEIDRPVARKARENARLNGVAEIVTVRQSDIRDWRPHPRHDLVFANLFSEIVIETAERIAAALKPKKLASVSGILVEQTERCSAALRTAGLEIRNVRRKGKWIALETRKPPGNRFKTGNREKTTPVPRPRGSSVKTRKSCG